MSLAEWESGRFENLVKFFRLSILYNINFVRFMSKKHRKLTAWPFNLTASHLTVENSIEKKREIKTFVFRSSWRPIRRFSLNNHSYQIVIEALTSFQYLFLHPSSISLCVCSFIVTASGVQTIWIIMEFCKSFRIYLIRLISVHLVRVIFHSV